VADEYADACHVLGAIRTTLGSPRSARDRISTSGSRSSRCSKVSTRTATFKRPTIRSRCRIRRHGPDRDRSAEGPFAAYDLVLNGWELGSGSVRIHRADIQSRVFRALGISEEEAESRFGFLLGAFKYGAPPHAGFAFGIDRLVAIFAGEENIREVIAYPKTQSGADLMTGAPKGVSPKVMRELRITITPKGS